MYKGNGMRPVTTAVALAIAPLLTWAREVRIEVAIAFTENVLLAFAVD